MKSFTRIVVISVIAIIFLIINLEITEANGNNTPIICRGETIVLTAQLYNDFNQNISNQTIEFFDETNDLFLGSAKTNAEGIAKFYWLIPINYSLGSIILNATFRGNESLFLAPSYQQISLNIFASTHLQVFSNQTIVAPEDFLNFTVLLVDDLNRPIPNALISVFSSESADLLFSNTTDILGKTTFKLRCNSSWTKIGENSLIITYAGDPSQFLRFSNSTFWFFVKKVQTVLLSNKSFPSSISIPHSYEILCQLKTEENVGIGLKVNVFLDKVKMKSLSTNSSGFFKWTVLTDELNLGKHLLEFEFPGTFRYENSTLAFEFNVTSSAIIDFKVTPQLIIGKTGSISVKVGDILGRPITNATVFIRDVHSFSSWIIYTDNEGWANHSFKVAGLPGNHIFSVKILGNPYLTNCTLDVETTFLYQPILNIESSNIMGFVYPKQLILVTVKLNTFNDSFLKRNITLFYNNKLPVASQLTDQNGRANFSFVAPNFEGNFQYSFLLINASDFEIKTKRVFSLIVTKTMPVILKLKKCKIIPALQEIQLTFVLFGKNGTLLSGVEIYYNWLSISNIVQTMKNGVIDLYLPIPSSKGVYNFSYSIKATSTIKGINGWFAIAISYENARMSQGVGFRVMSLCIVSSSLLILAIRINKKFFIL